MFLYVDVLALNGMAAKALLPLFVAVSSRLNIVWGRTSQKNRGAMPPIQEKIDLIFNVIWQPSGEGTEVPLVRASTKKRYPARVAAKVASRRLMRSLQAH